MDKHESGMKRSSSRLSIQNPLQTIEAGSFRSANLRKSDTSSPSSLNYYKSQHNIPTDKNDRGYLGNSFINKNHEGLVVNDSLYSTNRVSNNNVKDPKLFLSTLAKNKSDLPSNKINLDSSVKKNSIVSGIATNHDEEEGIEDGFDFYKSNKKVMSIMRKFSLKTKNTQNQNFKKKFEIFKDTQSYIDPEIVIKSMRKKDNNDNEKLKTEGMDKDIKDLTKEELEIALTNNQNNFSNLNEKYESQSIILTKKDSAIARKKKNGSQQIVSATKDELELDQSGLRESSKNIISPDQNILFDFQNNVDLTKNKGEKTAKIEDLQNLIKERICLSNFINEKKDKKLNVLKSNNEQSEESLGEYIGDDKELEDDFRNQLIYSDYEKTNLQELSDFMRNHIQKKGKNDESSFMLFSAIVELKNRILTNKNKKRHNIDEIRYVAEKDWAQQKASKIGNDQQFLKRFDTISRSYGKFVKEELHMHNQRNELFINNQVNQIDNKETNSTREVQIKGNDLPNKHIIMTKKHRFVKYKGTTVKLNSEVCKTEPADYSIDKKTNVCVKESGTTEKHTNKTVSKSTRAYTNGNYEITEIPYEEKIYILPTSRANVNKRNLISTFKDPNNSSKNLEQKSEIGNQLANSKSQPGRSCQSSHTKLVPIKQRPTELLKEDPHAIYSEFVRPRSNFSVFNLKKDKEDLITKQIQQSPSKGVNDNYIESIKNNIQENKSSYLYEQKEKREIEGGNKYLQKEWNSLRKEALVNREAKVLLEKPDWDQQKWDTAGDIIKDCNKLSCNYKKFKRQQCKIFC